MREAIDSTTEGEYVVNADSESYSQGSEEKTPKRRRPPPPPHEEPRYEQLRTNLFTKKLIPSKNLEGYEESTDWTITGKDASPVLMGPDGIKRKGVTTYDLIANHVADLPDRAFVGDFLKYLKDSGLSATLDNECVWTGNSFTLVKVKDKGKNKAEEALTIADKQAKQRREALTAFRKKDHVHGYASIKKHAFEFLSEYGPKLWPYEEWKANTAETFDFGFETTRFNKDSSVQVLETALKEFIVRHKKSELESLKGAYFIGRAVHFLRAKSSLTWTQTANRLMIGKSALAGKEKLFRFLNDYPLFLRMPIPYTSLLRYSADLVKHFKTNPDVGAKWRNLECPVVDVC